MASFSPTSLQLLAQCEAAWAFRYVQRTSVVSQDSGESVTGSAVHAALERAGRARLAGEKGAASLAAYLQAGERTPEALEVLEACAVDLSRVVAVEQNFELTLGAVSARGRCDRVDWHRDRVRVVDYKSGRYVPSREELETDSQTLIYLEAAFDGWPFADAHEVEYHYLRAGVRLVFRRTPARAEQVRVLVSAAAAQVARGRVTGTWPARVTSRCVRCDYRGVCAEYARALAGGLPALVSGEAPTGALALARSRVATLATLAEARRREYDTVLRARLARLPRGQAITSDGLRARLATRGSPSYSDACELVRALASIASRPAEEVAQAVLSVDLRQLDRWVATLAVDVRERAERFLLEIDEGKAGQYVEVREIKGGF